MTDEEGPFETVSYTLESGEEVNFLVRKGTWDAEMIREIWLDDYYTIGDGWGIRKGATVLDLGGGVGGFAVYAAVQGADRIFTFEPITETYELLSTNVAPYPSIHPTAMAVATEAGEVHMSGFALMEDGTINTGLPAITDEGGTTVRAVSIHDVLGGLPHWDVVKLDIEGYEYQLLHSLSDEELAKIGMITMEFHHGDETTCEEQGKQLGAWLMGYGFGTVEVSWSWGQQGRLRARR